MDDFNFDDLGEDALFPQDFYQNKDLINRYREQAAENRVSYFDVEQFEIIFDYFIYTYELHTAKSLIDHAKHQHPTDTNIKLKEAYLYTMTGKFNDALVVLQELHEYMPTSFEVSQLTGLSYSKLGQHESAITHYKKAISECDGEEKSQIMFELALELSSHEKNEQALDVLIELVKMAPDESIAIYEIMFCLQKLRKQERGLKIFNDILDKDPYNLAAWFNLGVCYNDVGDYMKALESYDYAIAIDPKHTPSQFNKGNIHYKLEQYPQAIDCYQEVVQLEEPMAITYCNIGECYEQLMEFDAALVNFKKAIAMDPNFADAYIGCAIAHDLKGDKELTLAMIEKANRIFPDNPDYLHFYAEMLKKSGLLEKAESAFERCLAVNPHDLNVYLGYIDCLFTLDKNENAFDTIKRAYDEVGESDELNIRILAYSLRTNQENKAVILLETLLNTDRRFGKKFLDYHPQALKSLRIVELIKDYTV